MRLDTNKQACRERAEEVRRLVSKGLATGVIAQRLGIRRSAVNRIIRNNNIERAPLRETP